MQFNTPCEDGRAPESFDVASVQSAFASLLLVLSCTDGGSKQLPPGTTFEIIVYSATREGVDISFFAEDSTRSAELLKPIGAQALKSVNVEGGFTLQVWHAGPLRPPPWIF